MKEYIFNYEDIEPVLKVLIPQMINDTSVIISVDGCCGSGKTAMAHTLYKIFSCNIIHMDDYYLPFNMRQENWEQAVAGNMDLNRILKEVLLPACQRENIISRPYNVHSDSFGKEELLLPHKLTVVEGSYSQHPLLASSYTLKIFLTCSREVQIKRLKQREGSNCVSFENRWIPMEENYFKRCNILEQSDLVIDTSSFFNT